MARACASCSRPSASSRATSKVSSRVWVVSRAGYAPHSEVALTPLVRLSVNCPQTAEGRFRCRVQGHCLAASRQTYVDVNIKLLVAIWLSSSGVWPNSRTAWARARSFSSDCPSIASNSVLRRMTGQSHFAAWLKGCSSL